MWDGNSAPTGTGSYSIVLNGSGASSAANEICPAEFPTDPILIDNGGDSGVGPNIGNSFEPFNVAIDYTNASSPGIYAIVVWSGKQPVGLPTQFGLFYLGGGQLLSTIGTHTQSVESWFPVSTGLVLDNDPALVGMTFTVQGFSGGYSPNGRLSSAIRQTIGS
ncbi:MAG: hypothetical protein ACI8QS_003503 [Planctomycetota bacterium]